MAPRADGWINSRHITVRLLRVMYDAPESARHASGRQEPLELSDPIWHRVRAAQSRDLSYHCSLAPSSVFLQRGSSHRKVG